MRKVGTIKPTKKASLYELFKESDKYKLNLTLEQLEEMEKEIYD